MRPSELKKADREDLFTLQETMGYVHFIMNHIPGVSWNDKRTLELWLDQIGRAHV